MKDYQKTPIGGGDTRVDQATGENKGAVLVGTSAGDGQVASEQTLLLLAAQGLSGVTVAHKTGSHAAADSTTLQAAVAGKVARVHRFDVVMGALAGTVSVQDSDDAVLWSQLLQARASADVIWGMLATALFAAAGKGIKIVTTQAATFNAVVSIED